MVSFRNFILLFTLLLVAKSEQKLRYDGYQLVKFMPKTVEQINLLKEFQKDFEFDVWSASDEEIEVLLSPQAFRRYRNLCKSKGINYKILHTNIQKLIDAEEVSLANSRLLNSNERIVGTYPQQAAINPWLDTIASTNRNYASTYIAGKTFENREMKVLKLKTPTATRSIWLDCGIHAREWIAISSCIWFIDKIIKDYNSGDAVAQSILDHFDIHVMPVVNPDGYAYSQYMGRLQRKNRSFKEPISWCYGVDLNRNWGYFWNVAGASNDPCNDVFAGYSADDQLETKAIQQIILSKLGNWDAFITIHAYGNYFMHPFGYGATLPQPNDLAIMKNLSSIAVASIKSVNGNNYSIGSPYSLLYAAAGGSFDWTYGVAGIVNSYALELTNGQNYGFIWPESQIPAIGNELYQGLRALFQAIKQ